MSRVPTALPATTAPGSITRLDPQALIALALDKGAGIDTLERLVALAASVRETHAREAWYSAMAEFQQRCPPIRRTKSARIATRGGASYSYHFAPLDEIMATILPVMTSLGLSVSWRHRVEGKSVIASCRIAHLLGHVEDSGDLAMPITEGDGGGANPAQRVGIASTYAKRYALLAILGLSPEDDDDTESLSAPTTPAATPRPTVRQHAILGMVGRAAEDEERAPAPAPATPATAATPQPFGAITMVTRMAGKFLPEALEEAFGVGIRNKSALEELAARDPAGFTAAYKALHERYDRFKAEQARHDTKATS